MSTLIFKNIEAAKRLISRKSVTWSAVLSASQVSFKLNYRQFSSDWSAAP